MKSIFINLFFALLITSIYSCNAQDDKIFDDDAQKVRSEFAVNGGYQEPIYLGTNESPYGYYFFTPESSLKSKDKYPLLIFLHGYGERGNSQTDHATLNKILVHGPCKMINNGTWKPSMDMFVASPQCHGDWWNRDLIKQFIEFLMESNDQIDQSRIYLTGLSMGGYATFDLLSVFGTDAHVAAAVPICGSGVMSEFGTANLAKIPLWVFHGDADKTVSTDFSKAIVPAINALNPKVKAKLTIYPGVGHDSWTRTYDGSGMGQEDSSYDPFNMDIYIWMNQYKKQ